MTALATRASVTTTGSPLLPRLSVAAGAGFVLAVVLAGLLDPGYSQVSEGISALASTESEAAPVMIPGLVLLGLSSVLAGAALVTRLEKGRAAGVLVALAGTLTGVAAFAQQSCSTLQQSCLDRESAGLVAGSHVVHNLVAMAAFLLLVIASGLIARALGGGAWYGVTVAELALVVWFGSQAFGEFGGLVQRAFVLLAYGFPIAIAVTAARTGARD